MIFVVLVNLRTPVNQNQRNIQLKITKELIKYPSIKNKLNYNFIFVFVVESLNVQLVDLVFNLFDIKINDLFDGYTLLQLVVFYMIEYSDINYEFAYETFDYLISLGADFNKKSKGGKVVDYWIEKITDETIKDKLKEIVTRHKSIINLVNNS